MGIKRTIALIFIFITIVFPVAANASNTYSSPENMYCIAASPTPSPEKDMTGENIKDTTSKKSDDIKETKKTAKEGTVNNNAVSGSNVVNETPGEDGTVKNNTITDSNVVNETPKKDDTVKNNTVTDSNVVNKTPKKDGTIKNNTVTDSNVANETPKKDGEINNNAVTDSNAVYETPVKDGKKADPKAGPSLLGTLSKGLVHNSKLFFVLIILIVLCTGAFFYVDRIKKGKKADVKTERYSKNTIISRKLTFGNAQHVGGREEQQDCFGISDVNNPALVNERGAMAVVADGMGGLDNGSGASSIVVTTLISMFEKGQWSGNIPEELEKMVLSANKTINSALSGVSGSKSGSTLVCVVIKDFRLHWISVGDSRIYLYRNKLYKINKDHAYASQLDYDAVVGKITFQEAWNNPERRALTSYLGADSVAEIDHSIKPFALLPGDRIILCSDGIYGSLDEKELEELVKQEPYKAAKETIRRVLLKNTPGQDNMTIVVIGND